MTAFARALLFNIYFFGLTALLGVAGLPVRVFARGRTWYFARFWVRLVLWGARVICGIRVCVSGLENLPVSGPALIASQHQSAFDTLVWMTLAPATAYVVKKELTRIPLFGPLLVPAGMIPVDRQAGATALRGLLAATRAARAQGRQIVIFPEGSRAPPDQILPLQPGIAAIATHLDLPVIPVATDSGRRWGRRAFMKHPGPIHIVIGPPIPAGTPRAELLRAIGSFWRDTHGKGFGSGDKFVDGMPGTSRDTLM